MASFAKQMKSLKTYKNKLLLIAKDIEFTIRHSIVKEKRLIKGHRLKLKRMQQLKSQIETMHKCRSPDKILVLRQKCKSTAIKMNQLKKIVFTEASLSSDDNSSNGSFEESYSNNTEETSSSSNGNFSNFEFSSELYRTPISTEFYKENSLSTTDDIQTNIADFSANHEIFDQNNNSCENMQLDDYQTFVQNTNYFENCEMNVPDCINKCQDVKQDPSDTETESLCETACSDILDNVSAENRGEKTNDAALDRNKFFPLDALNFLEIRDFSISSLLNEQLADADEEDEEMEQLSLICNRCDEKFSIQNYLENGMHNCIQNKRRCISCETNIVRNCNFKYYFRKDKFHEKCLSCKIFHKEKQKLLKLKQNLKCHCCLKWFKNSYNLKKHIRRRSGDKNFSCEICEKNYFTQFELRKHMRTHLYKY